MAYLDPRFGNGSSGSLVLPDDRALEADMDYDDLDLNGHVLFNDGYRLSVQGTLRFSGGTIHADGAAGAEATGGNSAVAGPLGAGGDGGTGPTGDEDGHAADDRDNVWAQHDLGGEAGKGGAGGDAAGRIGGAAGAVAAPAPRS